MSADWFRSVRKGNAWHGPEEFRPDSKAARRPHARRYGWLRRLIRAMRQTFRGK